MGNIVTNQQGLEVKIGRLTGSNMPQMFTRFQLWDGRVVLGIPTDDQPDVTTIPSEHEEVPPLFPELTPFIDKLLGEGVGFVSHVDNSPSIGSPTIRWSID